MNTAETAQILGILKTAYPSSFKDADTKAVIALWAEMFKDEPAPIVGAAVKALIASRKEGFTPTIGEIKEKIRLISEPSVLTETEAWALVSKACKNGIYGYKEEFEKLPQDVQKAVGRPEQLREWAMMDEYTVGSVVASNFMRSYRAAAKRTEEYLQIPTEIRNLLDNQRKEKNEHSLPGNINSMY